MPEIVKSSSSTEKAKLEILYSPNKRSPKVIKRSLSKVICDGTIDRFEVFRNNVEGHYGQIGAGYLFH
jgi:hypothetical protein